MWFAAVTALFIMVVILVMDGFRCRREIEMQQKMLADFECRLHKALMVKPEVIASDGCPDNRMYMVTGFRKEGV